MVPRVLALSVLLVGPALAGVTGHYARPPSSRPLRHEEALRHLADLGLRPGGGQRARGRSLRAASVAAGGDGGDAVLHASLTLGSPGEVVVTFATAKRGVPSQVSYGPLGEPSKWSATGSASVYSTHICPNNGNLGRPTMSTDGGRPDLTSEMLAAIVNSSAIGLPPTSAAYTKLLTAADAWKALEDECVRYTNPLGYYQSPYLHTVVLTGLEPRTTYVFRPASSSRRFTFTVPPTPGMAGLAQPLRIGVWGDIGTTNISVSVMKDLLSLQPDLALLAGDYSYADGWSPKWETFGMLMEPFMASVPHLGVVGNHEMDNGQYQAIDWMHRYPQPYRQSGSESPLSFSYETGPVHVLGLPGSYASTNNESSAAPSAQYLFAAEDLARVNRTRTPWVVVMFHTPMYCSNHNHYQEGLKHRWDMEELFFRYGVDLVFNGHVHAYERSLPVYQDRVNPCGTVHVVIGDAGNYEGPALPWLDPQPAWSAFREASFGGGLLTVQNETHAQWEWRRVACGVQAPAGASYKWGASFDENCHTDGDPQYQGIDSTWLVRDPSCTNREPGVGERPPVSDVLV